MPKSFLPKRDHPLAVWSANANARLVASGAAYFMSSLQVTAFTNAYESYADALAAATEPSTRTRSAVATKNVAKRNLLDIASSYGRMIEANNGISDALKLDIGVNLRKAPEPIPTPATFPFIKIVKASQNIVEIVLSSESNIRAGKKPGIARALIVTHIGPNPPSDPAQWYIQGVTGKNRLAIEFPLDAEPFSQVFISAAWQNPAGATGQFCPPQTTNLGTWQVTAGEGDGTPLVADDVELLKRAA